MARTVWGAHKRYMDTYLNVYPGYYVSTTYNLTVQLLTKSSSQEMVLGVTMRDTIGFVVVSMTWSTSLVTDCQRRKSRQLSLNIVSITSTSDDITTLKMS